MHLNIETERLLIRPVQIEDTNFMFNLVNTDGWLEFIGDRNIGSQIEARQYIQKIKKDKNLFYHVFSLKTSGEAIGIVSFIHRKDEAFPDIGFALLPGLEKKGYAFEATQSYLDALINSHRFETILAITLPSNQKSIRLIEKLGFILTDDHAKKDKTCSYYHLNLTSPF